ncbi:TPA: hypothetical protein DCZ15_02150 [Candidatus Falkowbacteria bacterium]|nr:MAG: hypothetical protein UV95_C0001G0176 [Candidatus Falkowbacteria bacterium GW2011_GWF2_43_32]HBA36656.1 hypothetical protein [Candidatus Falkowbacteria bacterium]
MPQNQPNNTSYIRWSVPEYRTPKRGRNWYIFAGLFVFLCLFFSFFSLQAWRLTFLGPNSNFLFALIIVIAAAIMIVNKNRPPLMVNVELGPEGVKVGRRFYDYDDFKSFAVLYKPKQSLKNLYFERKSSASQRLSLPLRHLDALNVRNFLIKYLDEDLERTNPPLSEQLTKLLKL